MERHEILEKVKAEEAFDISLENAAGGDMASVETVGQTVDIVAAEL